MDGGYFTLAQMRAHGKAGCYWLTSANACTPFIDEHGQCWDLVSFLRAQTGEEVDVQVLLVKDERLPVRLIARRVSPEQAERRRTNANREKDVKAKGVQRPNERKRRGSCETFSLTAMLANGAKSSHFWDETASQLAL